MKLQNDFFPENNNLLFLAVTFFFLFWLFFYKDIYMYICILCILIFRFSSLTGYYQTISPIFH